MRGLTVLLAETPEEGLRKWKAPNSQSALTEILARALGQTGNDPQDEPKP